MIHVAVIGCGRIAGHHCRSIRKTTGLTLVAVCDLVLEKAEAYAKEFSIPAYKDYREMLVAHPEISLVVIATPSGMHFEHSLEIIERYQKHVVVEKPTFMRPSQVRLAYQAAKKATVQIFPVFQNRYNRAVQRVQEGIINQELGKIRIASIRVRWCRPQRYYDLAPWRGTFSQDGGALTNQGIHHLDLLRCLAGNPTRVSCVMKTLGAAIEVEDTAIATLEFTSGTVGSFEISTAARPDDFEASLSLVCENGLAQIGGIAVNELQIYSPKPSECSSFSEDFSRNVYGHGHEFFYIDVEKNLRNEIVFPVQELDCLQTIGFLHSLYRSDEQDQGWVSFSMELESKRLGRFDEALSKLYRI